MLKDIQEDLIQDIENELCNNSNVKIVQNKIYSFMYEAILKPFKFLIILIVMFILLLYSINLYLNFEIYTTVKSLGRRSLETI